MKKLLAGLVVVVIAASAVATIVITRQVEKTDDTMVPQSASADVGYDQMKDEDKKIWEDTWGSDAKDQWEKEREHFEKTGGEGKGEWGGSDDQETQNKFWKNVHGRDDPTPNDENTKKNRGSKKGSFSEDGGTGGNTITTEGSVAANYDVVSTISCGTGGSRCTCLAGDACVALGDDNKATGSQGFYDSTTGQRCFTEKKFRCVPRDTTVGITILSADAVEGKGCSEFSKGECGGGGCTDGKQRTCQNGKLGACTGTDACAYQHPQASLVADGNDTCSQLKPLSSGEPSKGGFVGCEGVKNCHCERVGSTGLTGKVKCSTDERNDSCAAPGNPDIVITTEDIRSIQPLQSTEGDGGTAGDGGDGGNVTKKRSCKQILVYKVTGDDNTLAANWTRVPIADLPSLKEGDEIRIAVAGNKMNSFNKGRIRVNGAQWQETSIKNPFGEYYVVLTIPEGINNFTFESALHRKKKWYN